MRARFVSPWYPDYARPHSGIFVAKQVEAVRSAGHQVSVEVPQIFPAPSGPIPRVVTNSMRALATTAREAMFATSDSVTYLPTPVPSRSGQMGRAHAMSQVFSLFDEFRGGSPELIHAHLGVPTAWAVHQVYPDVPLVVTEHQSTLAGVFAERPATEAYAEVVRDADAFICVSDHLRDQIADRVGGWVREHIEVIPNIVDLAEIPLVERDENEFASWIYVGGLVPHKGVRPLLEAFAEYLGTHHRDATLTLVGDGPLRSWVREFAVSRGFADSIRFIGPVPHDQLGVHLADADVMVHLSPFETFGIAPLEGIGSGLPVVSLRNHGAVNSWGNIERECGVLLALESQPSDVAKAVAELRNSERLDPVAGRDFVVERYSPQVVGGRLVEVYERVLR